MNRTRCGTRSASESLRGIGGLAVLCCVLLVGCSNVHRITPSDDECFPYFNRVLPREIYSMYPRISAVSPMRDECIHHLFVCTSYAASEIEDPVSYLLDIAESDPRSFFRVAASDACRPLYEVWLTQIERECFTDFPGNKDLNKMEDRRIRVADKLRDLKMDERAEEEARMKLVDLLGNARVRRVD